MSSGNLEILTSILGESHWLLTSESPRESPREHVAHVYGRLRLIRSILRASNVSGFKLIEIVILWVIYIIPL